MVHLPVNLLTNEQVSRILQDAVFPAERRDNMRFISVTLLALLVLSSTTFAASSEGRIVLGQTDTDGRSITVPVTISSSQPLLAFSFRISYDSSLLIAHSADNSGLVTEDFEFFSARPEQSEGWVRVGGLTSFRLSKTIPPGEYQVANMIFLLKEETNQPLSFELEEVELVDLEMSEFKVEKVNTMAVPVVGPSTREYALYQNDPNPFGSETRIAYTIPTSTEVRLTVYNIAGQVVVHLVNQEQEAGHYTVSWNGRTDHDKSVPSGMYFYRLETRDFKATKKMIVAK
jgi:hypothetical protein